MGIENVIGLVLFLVAVAGIGYFLYKRKPWRDD